jgi:hypothetical protein
VLHAAGNELAAAVTPVFYEGQQSGRARMTNKFLKLDVKPKIPFLFL